MSTSSSILLKTSSTTMSIDDKNKLNAVQSNDPIITPLIPFKFNHSFDVNHKNNLLNIIPSTHVDSTITPPLTPPNTAMNTPAKSPKNNYFEDFNYISSSSDNFSPSSLNVSDPMNSNLTTPITDSLPNDDTKSDNKGEICIFTQVSTTIATVQQPPTSLLKATKKYPIRFRSSPNFKITKSSDQSNSDSTMLSNLDIDHYPDSSISTTTSDFEKDSSQEINSDSMMFDGTMLNDYAIENPKRNKEYHSFFKSIPCNEYLLNEILLQGRIYVSLNHICFHANILGWVTDVVIPFSDIKCIEKKMTALVIPNAIQITTVKSKYLFASFIFRDGAYDLFVKLWRRVNPTYGHRSSLSDGSSDSTQTSPSRATNDISCNNSGSSTESEQAKDSDNEKLKPRNGKFSLPRIPLISKQSSRTFEKFTINKNNSSPNLSLRNDLSGNDLSNISDHGNISESNSKKKKLLTPLKISIPKMSNKQQTLPSIEISQPKESKCKCLLQDEHSKFVILDTKYTGSIESIYAILFDSNFVLDFVRKLENNNDIDFGNWSTDENSCMTRNISYIKKLSNPLGPKSTKCYLTDEVLYKDFDDYVTIMTTTKTPDVPAGTSFCVKTRTCLMWAGANKTRVIVTGNVEFSKRTILKVPIEKGCMDGQIISRRSSPLQNDDEDTMSLSQFILSTLITILSQIIEMILFVIQKLKVPNLETLMIWALLLSLGVNIWIWISMRDINYKIEHIVQKKKLDLEFYKRIELNENDNDLVIRNYLSNVDFGDYEFNVDDFDKIFNYKK
ncbi:7577_t:CDS:2 [Gigaspora rosea]|nr:7577_t:CDS:2 [Gigaspora rosea]